ncbi:MAG: HEAT repeat domain-containing protein [Candidatus Methanospirare jalkutatii]|nr:HEAT repeat domain-containing protein [Candidatus Methanospirare jalkutatii]
MEDEERKGRKIKVLYVDDEEGAIHVTNIFLKRMGYDNIEITPALSAKQGLELLKDCDFDVIISDYMMPDMSGIEFLEEVRRRGIKTPFIIFTGRGEERVAMEALNKGANRYVRKDRKPSEVFEELARYIVELAEEKRREEEKERELRRFKEGHPFIVALYDDDWRLRKCAADALGKLKDAQAVEPLSEVLLKDEDADVRASAAQALGEIGDAKAVEKLIKALNDEDRGVREKAVAALGKMGMDAFEPLVQALSAKKARVRKGAALALGNLRMKDAIEPLTKALHDKNFEVRWCAAQALANIGAFEPLIEASKEEDEEVRWCAVSALGKLKDERAVKHLISLLDDPSEKVRASAAWALGEIGDASAVEKLIKALGDASRFVVESAKEALLKIGISAIPHLIKALKEDKLQRKVVEILSKIEGEGVKEYLIRALSDKNKKIRIGAALALAKRGEEGAESAISKALASEEDIEVQHAFEEALEEVRRRKREKAGRIPYAKRLAEEVKKRMREKEGDFSMLMSGVVGGMESVEGEEKIHKNALNPSQVRILRNLLAKGFTEEDIAKKMGIPHKVIADFLKEERRRKVGKMLHIHKKKI